jgi:CRP-like cAMP-binding protein
MEVEAEVMLQEHFVNGQCGANGTSRDPRLVEGVVANLPLFRDVSRANVAMAASHARIEHHRRGSLIARQGEPLPGMIALAYGLAKLVLPRRKGEEKVLRFVGANESFGEAATLLDRPCPVDAFALADTMLAVIPARPLRQLQERDAMFASNLVKTLAQGLLDLVADIDSSAVQLPVTKTALAARLGITKETMSRLLRELKDQGLILMDRSTITILDRERLAGLAN